MTAKSLPPAQQPKSTTYHRFLGVDYSVDASLVKPRRSPSAFNVLPDRAGTIIKRYGWENIYKVNRVDDGAYVDSFVFGLGTDGKTRCAIITKKKIIYGVIEKENSEVRFLEKKKVSACDPRHQGQEVQQATGFYLRDSKKDVLSYYVVLNTGMFALNIDFDIVDVEPYIPTIAISKGLSGEGVLYEDLNLLTTWRKEHFYIENKGDYTITLSVPIEMDGLALKGDIKGEYLDEDGNKVPLGSMSVNKDKVKLYLPNNAPVTGADNVFITYTPNKSDTKSIDKILKCNISTVYGYGTEDRIFLSGNKDFPSYDWWSSVGNPTYFPDTNYAITGSGESAIMGYHKLGEYLAIIKEESQSESTMFLRRGEIITETKGGVTSNKTVFRVKQAAVGIGASDKRGFAVVNDEPLFLSSKGVYGITSTLIGQERTLKNRSYFIDSALNGKGAACEWNGFYVIGTDGGNAYLLDGKQKAGRIEGIDYIYECYHFKNIWAEKFHNIKGELFFFGHLTGTDPDVHLMTFANKQYYDGKGEDKKPVVAQWTTPNDDDGATYLYKTLQKKGSLVTLAPYSQSGGKVYFVKDGDPEIFVREQNLDIFSWGHIDFERFTFSSNKSPQEIYFRKKQKKYKRLQIVIRNDKPEPFGIYQIIKLYTVGNYSKNRR